MQFGETYLTFEAFFESLCSTRFTIFHFCPLNVSEGLHVWCMELEEHRLLLECSRYVYIYQFIFPFHLVVIQLVVSHERSE